MERNFSKIAWGIGFIGTAEAWLHFLWPPFARYLEQSDKSIWPIVFELLKPTNRIYPETAGMGYLFLLLSIPFFTVIIYCIIQIVNYIENSFIPISVLETKLVLTFEDDNLSRSRLRRDQLYHANRTNQTAYHMKTSVNATDATIEKHAIWMESSINGKKISTDESPLIFGNKKSVEIIEQYDCALPPSLLASLMPNSWVLVLYKAKLLFRNKIASRTGEVININEYNGENPMFTLTSQRYPVTDVDVSVVFPSKSAPEKSGIQAWLVRENIAHRIRLDKREENGQIRYNCSMRKFYHCTLRIWWSNPKLPTSQI